MPQYYHRLPDAMQHLHDTTVPLHRITPNHQLASIKTKVPRSQDKPGGLFSLDRLRYLYTAAAHEYHQPRSPPVTPIPLTSKTFEASGIGRTTKSRTCFFTR